MYRTLKAKREPSTESSFKMARRKSYQKGNVQWRNNQWTLRYYLLDHYTSEYKLKRESEALRHCTDRNNKKAALRAADEIITKNIYIYISQEQASSVIEAVANRIFGESSNMLAQESQSVN